MNTTNPEMMTDNQIRNDYERLLEENTKLKNRWQPPLGATNFGDLIAEKDAEIKKLKNEITQSMKILREANCEIVGDIKDGVTKDQLKKENQALGEAMKKIHDEANSSAKAWKDAVVEALGGPDFNEPYEGCIRLRDITCEIAGLKKQNDELISYRDELLLKETKTHNENVALKSELEEIKEVKKIVTEVATQTETDGLQEEIDKLKKNNEDGCKLIKALMDKLHPITARVLGVAQYLVENPYYEGEDNVIERSTICDLLGFTPEFLKEVEDNGGKVAKDIGLVMAKIAMDEIEEEEEEEKFCADCDIPHKCEDCVKESKEDEIIREFGDQSIQAKRAGIGVFKKE